MIVFFSFLLVFSKAFGASLEEGIKYAYTKEDYSRFCSLERPDTYLMSSSSCLELILIEYSAQNQVDPAWLNNIRNRALAVFLKNIFKLERNYLSQMKPILAKISISVSKILVNSMSSVYGSVPAARALGINPQHLSLDKSLFDGAASGPGALLRTVRNAEGLYYNIERDAYAWASFSATGNAYQLMDIIIYVNSAPKIVIDLYNQFYSAPENRKNYGLIPERDTLARMIAIEAFLKANAELLQLSGESDNRVTPWSAASYLLVMHHMLDNASRYSHIKERIINQIKEEGAYGTLRQLLQQAG